jgi:hypothetical protein
MHVNRENVRTQYGRSTDAVRVELEGMSDRHGEMATGATGRD